MRPTTSADLPEARRFVEMCRAAGGPITGLRLLSLAKNHERATDMLRALEDRGDVRCTGMDPKCPKTYRTDLVGQLYEVVPDYRYTFGRVWNRALPLVVWVCLNPSTADTETDDQTTRKIRGFSERWGFGRFLLVNLYPMRATSPADLLAANEAMRFGLGDTHTAIISAAFGDAVGGIMPGKAGAVGDVVFAWGAHGAHRTVRARRDEVLALPRPPGLRVWCLGRCQNGEPRHPLTLAYATLRERW
jgi:hypothetical protein